MRREGTPEYTDTLQCTVPDGETATVKIVPTTALPRGAYASLDYKPTKAGDVNCNYLVTDKDGQIAATTFMFTVGAASTLQMSGGTTGGASGATGAGSTGTKITLTAGKATSTAMEKASGGVPPYRYALTCQPTIVGIEVFPSGETGKDTIPKIVGTPEKENLAECQFSVTDAVDTKIERQVQIAVEAAEGTLTLESSKGDLDLGTLAYRASMEPKTLKSASGGTAPYTYEFKCAGENISGVKMDPAGAVDGNVTPVLTGRPEEAGQFRCTLSVEDNSTPIAQTATRGVKLTIEQGQTFTGQLAAVEGTCVAKGSDPVEPTASVMMPTATGTGTARYGTREYGSGSWTVEKEGAGPPTKRVKTIALGSSAEDNQRYLYMVGESTTVTTTNAHDGVCAYGRKEKCTTDTVTDGTRWVLRLATAEYGNAGWSCPTLSEGTQGAGATENSATGGAIAGLRTNPVHTALLPAQGAQWGEGGARRHRRAYRRVGTRRDGRTARR